MISPNKTLKIDENTVILVLGERFVKFDLDTGTVLDNVLSDLISPNIIGEYFAMAKDTFVVVYDTDIKVVDEVTLTSDPISRIAMYDVIQAEEEDIPIVEVVGRGIEEIQVDKEIVPLDMNFRYIISPTKSLIDKEHMYGYPDERELDIREDNIFASGEYVIYVAPNEDKDYIIKSIPLDKLNIERLEELKDISVLIDESTTLHTITREDRREDAPDSVSIAPMPNFKIEDDIVEGDLLICFDYEDVSDYYILHEDGSRTVEELEHNEDRVMSSIGKDNIAHVVVESAESTDTDTATL